MYYTRLEYEMKFETRLDYISQLHGRAFWIVSDPVSRNLSYVLLNGPLTRFVKLWATHAPGMPGTFSPPPRFGDPDMHQGTCVMHVPWCMPGTLTSDFLWSQWRGKRSRHCRACATYSFAYLVRGPCVLRCHFKFILWCIVNMHLRYYMSMSVLHNINIAIRI